MSDIANTSVPAAGPATTDRMTRWLLWGIGGAVLMLFSLGAYAVLTQSADRPTTPRTLVEDRLATTAAAIEKDPSNGAAHASRAEALYESGDAEAALQALVTGETAVKGKNPALLYILRARTGILNRLGRYDEAIVIGKRAMQASDDYLKAQGVVLTSKGISVLGGNTQSRASVDTALQVAEAYMGRKQYDKALELYQYALFLEPLAADVLTMRGWAYLEKGDTTKARADFTEALTYLPNDPSASKGLAASTSR